MNPMCWAGSSPNAKPLDKGWPANGGTCENAQVLHEGQGPKTNPKEVNIRARPQGGTQRCLLPSLASMDQRPCQSATIIRLKRAIRHHLSEAYRPF